MRYLHIIKNICFINIITLFSVLFICSCSGKPDKARKPVIRIDLLSSSKNYVLGQSLSFKINTILKDGKLKNVQIFLNNKLVDSTGKTEYTYTVPSLTETGINTLRVVAEKTDGLTNSRTQNFSVLSDIVPEKYTYTVVREYAHSKEHFTQGLQIKNEFLYEGTGENGKSGLYKISLGSNKIVMNKPLPEKYFGEGITVLNEKIYQLTYKHQVGFVYNLSDFAVIDSFKFDSPEGWGLTNDGKSLIMSDGTGTLTWLNPENYNVEKKLQVADNQKIYQYLNELEYYNGSIWANIWTSNQIIKIDPGSGKITGILDLNSILSIMDTNQSERIDVLNGIAILPQTGNLLVTGKLWPKMFELKISILK
jgi:glutaminyl-peptide cyclotransferase